MGITLRRIDKVGELKAAEKRARASILRRSGAYVRKIARDHVKHRADPDMHSQPGHSPYDHFGLRNSIIFATDETSAYIGPRYIRNGLANVARLHEFGGKSIVKSIDQNLFHGVSVGDVAPVTSRNVTKRDSILRRESRKDAKTGREVVWIRIRTKAQAAHSTRLYRRFSPLIAKDKLVRYAPRPYMNPALVKSLPHLNRMWRQSIKQ